MCGIYFSVLDYINYSFNTDYYDNRLSKSLDILKPRGPDSQCKMSFRVGNKQIHLGHTRLQINGNDTPQPITDSEKKIILIINGEIFNWKELEKELNYSVSQSDCEILIPLYKKYKFNLNEFFNKINGQFSMVLIDLEENKLLISRDHIGVTSMYYNFSHNELTISSNIKCFKNNALFNFEPRMYIYTDINDIRLQTHYYTDYNNSKGLFSDPESIKTNINSLLTSSVKLRMQNLKNNTYGFLLSGGLDSSLICSIASKLQDTPIKTFSIGLSDSIDLMYAKQVAAFIGSEHTEYIISKEEICDNVENIINVTETYDITTIRASIPMFLLIQKIKQIFPDIKVLFSGELSDELFCYLYGSNAPSIDDFQKETETLVNNVYKYDCLRADKTSMANGVEIRVPFTDPYFVKYVLQIDPEYKTFGNIDNNNSIEKNILRQSFAAGYLPDNVLFRKKEQFSDGVSSLDNNETNLIYILKQHCKKQLKEVYNTEIKETETSWESRYYRLTFNKLFKGIVYNLIYWRPKWSESNDPSGREQSFWYDN